MRPPQTWRRVFFFCSSGVTGNELIRELQRGDRRALARAITLIESTRPDHRDEAEKLVEALLPRGGGAIRIGISGPPGAGKSTFIERFGLAGIDRGHRIAVLAVDPASKRGGGAILGDKTRMACCARRPGSMRYWSKRSGSANPRRRSLRSLICSY
jgi:LAO/AO transport system kinase